MTMPYQNFTHEQLINRIALFKEAASSANKNIEKQKEKTESARKLRDKYRKRNFRLLKKSEKLDKNLSDLRKKWAELVLLKDNQKQKYEKEIDYVTDKNIYLDNIVKGHIKTIVKKDTEITSLKGVRDHFNSERIAYRFWFWFYFLLLSGWIYTVSLFVY